MVQNVIEAVWSESVLESYLNIRSSNTEGASLIERDTAGGLALLKVGIWGRANFRLCKFHSHRNSMLMQ